MTLWHLLTATSSTTFFVSSVLSAKHAKAGFAGYAVAVILGLLLAAGNAWVVHELGRKVYERSKLHSNSRQEWYFSALYLAAVLWIPLAAFLGGKMTSSVLRLSI